MLLASIGSIRAESELSLLSAILPVLAVALAVGLGLFLRQLRVRVHSGPHGLRAEQATFGAPRPLLTVPLEALGAVHAVGHPNHPERHLLVETQDGPVSLACADAAARQVARYWAANARVRTGGAS
ncbi:MAG: hypothetical protein QM756_11985 [Polyangiaceae bacterium]